MSRVREFSEEDLHKLLASDDIIVEGTIDMTFVAKMKRGRGFKRTALPQGVVASVLAFHDDQELAGKAGPDGEEEPFGESRLLFTVYPSIKAPSGAEKLLCLLVPADHLEQALGDMEELFREITNRHGIGFARGWYWWKVACSAGARLVAAGAHVSEILGIKTAAPTRTERS